ncbi:hypothetical protein ACFYXS_18590 [Streptomyces sp. NPDC002574]|uniref:hypothetical protein n=1 Tax=Streptomyces sp. NPDC002574 TaxID=3364652 RepID=UPI003685E06F
MNAADAHALLGGGGAETVRAQARRAVETAPPSPELLARLRRVFLGPASVDPKE